MIADLTEYVRSLGAHGEPPAPGAYEAARELLRAVLVREMMRRGLWSAPPEYLGIPGGRRWSQETIDELVSDCYADLFLLPRLASLKNKLLVQLDVNGVITLCVRNFVHDRQKAHDRLGFKVYEILRASLERLCEKGVLRLALSGRKSIHNGTVFVFAPQPLSAEVPAVDLGPQAQAWCDELWPELITAQGRARSKVLDRLDACLAALGEAGIEAFRFKDLAEPVKKEIRRRWLAEVGDWIVVGADPVAPYRELGECVAEKLATAPPAQRRDLRELWAFLWSYSVGLADGEVAEKAEKSDRPPTDLGLARELGIPRQRIPGLKETLGRWIQECRSAVSGIAAVRGSEGDPREVPDGMRATIHREELRRSSGQDAARWSAGRAAIQRDPRPPCPGDVYVLSGGGDLLVEWLVVAKEGDRLLVIPGDVGPVGSRDVAVSPEDACGLTSVHCALDLWLGREAFDPKLRTGSLSPETLGQVLRKRAAVADGSAVGSRREQEVDDEAEYQDRMKELAKLCSSLSSGVSRSRERAASNRRSLALAASILLVLGFAGGWIWQQRKLADLEHELRGEPQINLPAVWLTADERVRGEAHPLDVPPEARRVALILAVASPELFPRYRVEVLLEGTRQEVWASDELLRRDGEVSFDLPRSLLRTGGYDLRVYGLRPKAEAKLLEEYSVWIRME